MWATVGFMNMVRAVLVLTDDSKRLLWPCYFTTSLFKVSVYHFFMISRVCSPKFPWGVIHGCFHNFSSQLRWLIKNRTTVLKVFHGSILPLNCSCLISYPCYIYLILGGDVLLPWVFVRGMEPGTLHQILRKSNIELASLNIQRINLIIIILFQCSPAYIWNYIYIYICIYFHRIVHAKIAKDD